MGKPYDPLEGVSAKTTKDDLMDRLRRAAAALRRQESQDKKRLAEIEDRLRAKYSGTRSGAPLKQAIISSTEEEWKDLVEFLEEFEDLLPTAGHRIVLGGRILLGQIPTEPDPQGTPAP